MSFFDLPHIFVVFPPGASGNFITNLLQKTLYKTFDDIALSSTGNAHANSTSKLDFTDVMSFGLRYGVPSFNSVEEKFDYYKKEIIKKHSNDTDIKVSWTHDFSNIPLYKELFPNCKILAVTHDSNKEKLTVLIQQELKNRLDPAGFLFIQGDTYDEQFKTGLRLALMSGLKSHQQDLAHEISNNFKDPKYKDIITFMAIRIMLKFYAQEHLVDSSIPPRVDYLSNCTIPRFVSDPTHIRKKDENISFIVGPSYSSFLTDDCLLMPYSVIMNNDIDAFLKIVKHILGITLDNEQENFVRHNFKVYYDKQSCGLLIDPVEYYNNLRDKFRQQLMTLLKN